MRTIYNQEAEENVLGALLMANAEIPSVLDEGLKPEHFYKPSHGAIYQAILDLDGVNSKADTITVSALLEQRGTLAKVGGKAAVSTLASVVASTANANLYAAIVVEQATTRRLKQAATTIATIAEGPGVAAEKMADAEKALFEAADAAHQIDFQPLGSELDDVIAEINEAKRLGRERTGLKTGLTRIDQMTHGLFPGQLIILAARPGMGKSLLAQNICENVAKRGEAVCIFSMEMTREQIGIRMISSLGGVPFDVLQTGQMSAVEHSKMLEAHQLLGNLPVFVADTEEVTMPALRAQVKRLHRQKDIKLLVVDYLQLMISDKSTENRNIEISQISRGLKRLAGELQIPVLAVAQLSRAVEQRSDKRPGLADLRDSGSIEQDADAVMFIFREEYYDPTAAPGEAEILVAKQRSGATGRFKLAFVGKRCHFGNLGGADTPKPDLPADVPF